MKMAKKGRPPKGDTPMGPRTKTSLVIPEGLLQRLKFAALEERTDVSSLLCRLAELYLKRKGGR
jgi:hypothetical protein